MCCVCARTCVLINYFFLLRDVIYVIQSNEKYFQASNRIERTICVNR
jgi:hypothetical protein